MLVTVNMLALDSYCIIALTTQGTGVCYAAQFLYILPCLCILWVEPALLCKVAYRNA
jgi:hypothetical protein